ncbi:hypothetical protein N7513_006156 [Penicillium frequentans]|nr:hypothetical protein N7513_006156 [Penicillium glabrum]
MNESDTYYQGILATLAKTADTAVATPLTLSSATSWSSTIRMNVGATAGTYLLTGNTKYSDWVIDSIILLANLSDWDVSDFLNTADIAMTISIGYDWVYDMMTAAQRTSVQSAIANKAFIPALNSIGDWRYQLPLAEEIMDFSLPKLNVSLEQYAPDGGWIEGYSYGTYAGIFFGLMMKSLDTALGDDLGISDLPGMSGLGAWLTHGFGQTGGFSWGDGAWTFSNANSLWSAGYWAQRFNKPEWLQGMLSRFTSTEAATFQAFLFYNSSLMTPSVLSTMPLYDQFTGVAGMTYRTSWTDSDGWFFGFMSGFNGRSHGHLDAGSFVVDYKGYRWAELLGSDSYSLTNYFVGPRRWTYYRCRSEGSNTLSISDVSQTPLHFANQIPSSNNSLRWVGSFDDSSRFGVANLTQAYNNVTTSVLRGVALLNGTQLIIRDEVRASTAIDIATSWHTTATISVATDNQTATLTQDDITMTVTLLSPSNAYLEAIDTNPCNAYSPCSEATNSGIYNLAVRLTSLTKEADIVVALSESGTELESFDSSLSDWYSLCTVDCWESANVEDPYWLEDSEVYY